MRRAMVGSDCEGGSPSGFRERVRTAESQRFPANGIITMAAHPVTAENVCLTCVSAAGLGLSRKLRRQRNSVLL